MTFIKEETKKCIELQDSLGLDVLVHGEFERSDMVEFFCEKMIGWFLVKDACVCLFVCM